MTVAQRHAHASRAPSVSGPGFRSAGPLRAAAAGVVSLGLFLWAAASHAIVWEVHNNANDLSSVRVAGDRVWTLSLNGAHAFDPVTSSFTRYFREPGGLVSNRAIRAAEDEDGNVWIGTDGGGSAFLTPDGRWRQVTAQQGLPSDSVRALESFGGGMWIGTNVGLTFFVGQEITGAWPDGVSPSPFASNDIRAVESFGSRTWVGTTNGVYTTVDGVAWDTLTTGLGSTNIVSLAHDGTRIWALTVGGQLWWNGGTGNWGAAPAPSGVVRLTATSNGLYTASPTGVSRYDETSGVWQSLGGPNAVDVDAASGLVWAASASGLWRFNGTSWVSLRSPGPAGNWVQGVDRQGSTIYCATRDAGTARYDDARGWRTFLGTSYPDTAFRSNDFHFACLVDREGYKWVGDWGGSIARFDDSSPTTTFTHFFDSSPDSGLFTVAWAGAHDPTGPRWFGLDTPARGIIEARGIVRIDANGSRHIFDPSNSAMSGTQVRTVVFAPDGAMWIGYADAGVDVYQDRDLQVRLARIDVGPEGLLNPDVWSIVFEGSDAWILCSGSVVKVRLSGSATSRIANVFLPVISNQGAVRPMALDAEGTLWFGTASGLVRRRSSGLVDALTTNNSPLLSNDVHSVVFDPATGDLWVGTVLGLNRLRPDAPPSGAHIADLPALIVAPNPQRVSAIGSQFRVSGGNGQPLARTDVHIYDLRGRLLAIERTDDFGVFFWTPTDRFGRRLPVGVYYLRSFGFDEAGRPTATGNGRLVLAP